MRGRVGVLHEQVRFGAASFISQGLEGDRPENRSAQSLKSLLALGSSRFQSKYLAHPQPGMVFLEVTRAFAPGKLNTVNLSGSRHRNRLKSLSGIETFKKSSGIVFTL
jgi:hypothetical protein